VRSIDVRVALGDGRELRGTVPGVAGDVLRTVVYSRLGPKHRLAAWVRLLALAAGRPERRWTAVTVGRGEGTSIRARVVPPLEPADALAALEVLLDLHARGLREPLPLFCATSAAYAAAAGDPVEAARTAWTSTYGFDREDAEPEHVLVLGGQVAFEEVRAGRPAPGEDWHPEEPTRFGRLARRLWADLLDHEEPDA
jgi:exodeoxyribonuclease V gamma subunit